jgi:hypothetical protein
LNPFPDVLKFQPDRDRLVKQFQKNLLKRSISELSKQIADGDLSSALQAAYSKVARLKVLAADRPETEPHSLDAWFLGIVEGRLRVEIPVWWTAESCGFQLTETGWEPRKTPLSPMKYGFPTAATESGFGARLDVQSRVIDGILEVSDNGKMARIPLLLFGDLYDRINRDLVDVLVDRNRAFIGLYQRSWSVVKVRVVCVTYPECMPLWGAQTFTVKEDYGKAGARSLFEMRMAKNDVLCVFSTEFHEHACAIDGFSRSDGATVFRFSQVLEHLLEDA